jgi:Lipocalin-like domain
MKTKTSTLKAFILKALLIITGITFGFSSLNKCDAQSIEGKWKEVSGKDYCTAKGVKATGKQFLPQAPQMGGQVLEIRSDHTFTSSELMNWVPSSVKLTGTWTLSGDQLTTKLDLHQSDPINNPAKDAVTTIYTMTINGDNMILSLPMNNRSPIIERMEKTYKKM